MQSVSMSSSTTQPSKSPSLEGGVQQVSTVQLFGTVLLAGSLEEVTGKYRSAVWYRPVGRLP